MVLDLAAPRIITIETAGLGDRSYLVHDGEIAVVIDPQRDIDRVLAIAQSEKVRITHVFETHIHNDYVTGGLALAEAVSAAYVVSGDDDVAFEHQPAVEGSRFETGQLVIVALATPGHTPHHLAYQLSWHEAPPVAVFTGGSMLFGAVGRTDLIAPESTDDLTRAQYRSVRRLAFELPGAATVHPTHGFGSFCSATETTGTASTIGNEVATNIALRIDDEDSFVSHLVAGLGAYPRYYAHMAPANSKGPSAPDLSEPRVAAPSELRERIDAGEWVVDLRARRAFADRHVAGTISVELGDSFVTFLGWTIPWGSALSLIGDDGSQVAEAQRQLVRIGIDELAAQAIGDVDSLAQAMTASYPVASFEEVGAVLGRDDVVVLDVRRPDEWEAGHLQGAVHIPFWEIEARVDELPDKQIWVHCASGFRASISSSLLDRAGRSVVHVDDSWARAGELGLPVVP
ncbi:MAG: MBL fold metallo-hydrolase [Acidimicrobiales bacterium]